MTDDSLRQKWQREGDLIFRIRARLFAVFDCGPELIPVKGPAELSVMALLAISGAQSSEIVHRRCSTSALFDVQAAGTVTTLAADID